MSQLIFVVGPTACGKSDFAVEACELLMALGHPAEIINCDSVQFFAGVDIGAAKPSRELLDRVPHHLIGTVPLGAPYTAGDFRRDALDVVSKRPSVRYFLVVGGSGFHFQALEKGMYEVPEIPDSVREQLERDFETKDLPALHRELAERDPEAAEKIKPADRYRIWRALEILRAQPGGTLTGIRAKFAAEAPPPPFTVQKIGLFRPRDILRERVKERTKKMLAGGLIEEVERLRAQDLGDWFPMRSVGYKEVQEMLDGRLAPELLEPAVVTSTMQLAKRQMTWFKRDREIAWFDTEKGFAPALEHLKQLVRR